jgi:predicted NAD/FAD-dependent oxidoreductase
VITYSTVDSVDPTNRSVALTLQLTPAHITYSRTRPPRTGELHSCICRPSISGRINLEMRRCLAKLESATRPGGENLRLLIVGGGPTGALTAARLRETYPAASITIVDKARAPGGRMHTLRASGAGRGSSVDTGAQYITALPRQHSSRLNNALIEAGVLQPLEGSIVTPRLPRADQQNLVSANGFASLVHHLIDSARAVYVPSSKLLTLDIGTADGAAHPDGAAADEDDGALRWIASVQGGALNNVPAAPSTPGHAGGSSSEEAAGDTEALASAADAAVGGIARTGGAPPESVSATTAAVSPASPAASHAAAAAAAASGAGGTRDDGGDECEACAPHSPSIAELLPSSLASSGHAGGGTASVGAAAANIAAAATAAGASAASASGTSSAAFHAVVLTCPVPQALAIGGDLPAMIEGSGTGATLAAVTYSSRYSLALFFGPGDWQAVAEALPYTGRYVGPHEDDVIRYISFDSAKRGVLRSASAGAPTSSGSSSASSGFSEPCPAVLVHTGIDFGRLYVDTEPALVAPIVLEHLRRLHPGLPPPLESHCHRWRYSQVARGYDGPEPFERSPSPLGSGASLAAVRRGTLAESHTAADVDEEGGGRPRHVGALLVVDDPPLVLAGDGFTGSHFDGCVESAEKVGWRWWFCAACLL